MRPSSLFLLFPLGHPGISAALAFIVCLWATWGAPPPAHGVLTVAGLVGRYNGPSSTYALAALVSLRDLFGREVTSSAAAGLEEPWRVAGGGGGARWRSAAAGLAGLAGLGPARGAVRQSVGERGGGGGEGRGEGRPLPYMAQAPPPDVTL